MSLTDYGDPTGRNLGIPRHKEHLNPGYNGPRLTPAEISVLLEKQRQPGFPRNREEHDDEQHRQLVLACKKAIQDYRHCRWRHAADGCAEKIAAQEAGEEIQWKIRRVCRTRSKKMCLRPETNFTAPNEVKGLEYRN